MRPSRIETYRQNRTAEYLEKYPGETWRADIFASDGSDHHGVGSTEATALLGAATAYARHRMAGRDVTQAEIRALKERAARPIVGAGSHEPAPASQKSSK